MQKQHAVISGDVVAFTSLTVPQRREVEAGIAELFAALKQRFGIFSRLARGDFLEFYVPQPQDSLRAMLVIKCFLKALPIDLDLTAQKRAKFFKTYGIRLALGIGELLRLDLDNGIIDGEAIYFSGRRLSEEKTHGSERVTVKSTLFFRSGDEELNAEMEPLLALLDELLNRATGKQCEVVRHRLMGKDEQTISAELKREQHTINRHSTQAGWHAIEKAVARFESIAPHRLAL